MERLSPSLITSSSSSIRNSGWVEHDPIRHSHHATRLARLRRWERRASVPATLPPSASPTSARRRSSGIARPESLSITPSCGRIAEPRRCARSWWKRARKRKFARAPGCVSIPTSPPPKSLDSRQCSGCACPRRGGEARLRHSRYLADLESHQRRQAHHRLRPTHRARMLFNIVKGVGMTELLQALQHSRQHDAGSGLRPAAESAK